MKPANVLVDHHGHAKVTDFGLAKEVGHDRDLTRTGTAAGTPLYMAPEQIRDAKRVDARADVWSLGVVLYELVTGQTPFAADDTFAIFERVVSGTYELAIRRATRVQPMGSGGSRLVRCGRLPGGGPLRLPRRSRRGRCFRAAHRQPLPRHRGPPHDDIRRLRPHRPAARHARQPARAAGARRGRSARGRSCPDGRHLRREGRKRTTAWYDREGNRVRPSYDPAARITYDWADDGSWTTRRYQADGRPIEGCAVLTATSLHPGWTRQACTTADGEPTPGSPSLKWGQGTVSVVDIRGNPDRPSEVVYRDERGGPIASSDGTARVLFTAYGHQRYGLDGRRLPDH